MIKIKWKTKGFNEEEKYYYKLHLRKAREWNKIGDKIMVKYHLQEIEKIKEQVAKRAIKKIRR